jgi:urease accessory protein
MSGHELLIEASETASESGAEIHLAPCFGLAAGALNIDVRTATAACLQQSMTSLISACQRLLPLGQTRAQQILWHLKPAILQAVEHGIATPPAKISCFTPLVDLASARHAALYTRLFMS